MVGKGPSPDVAIDICREKCERIVVGNHEELVRAEKVFGGDEYVEMQERQRKKIGQERCDFLLTLENSIDVKMSGKNVRLFHASPVSALHRVRRSDGKEKHLSMFESTDFTGFSCEPDVVGYGDIHVSFVEVIGGKILFNVGSVGNPLGIDTRASFGIISGEYGSDAEDKLEIEIVKVDYDKDKAIEDARGGDLPEAELYVNEIMTGIYRGV